MSQLSDAELVQRYKESEDKEFLGILYKRYISMVMGVSMKYYKNKEVSEDSVMEIFEVITTDLLKHEVQYFKSWLYMVTRNYCLMKISKEKTRRKRHDHFAADERTFMESESVIHLSEEHESEKQYQELEACIEALKEEQQSCIRLFYLQEKCYNEIASITGYALKKVKSYIQNGKRNLKLCLGEKLGQELA